MAPRAGEKPMNRTTRRARFALPTAFAALVATGFSAASLAAGCGSGQTNDSACALGSEGCPCDTEGVAVGCSESVDYIPGTDTTQCRSGTRTCQGGKWGACVGTKRSFQSVPSAVLKSTTPTPCTSNPCDPGCQVFVDTGSDLDAGTGITTNEAGGISLTPQEAGTTSNWDGGVNEGGTACTTGELKCQIPACSTSGGYLATKITGSVFDPAGKNPIPNVLVYIPNGTPTAPTDGLSCSTCQTGTGAPIVSAVTDYKGSFTLQGVPAGTNIPIVIQSGKWYRQLTISSVAACTTNQSDTLLGADGLKLIRFPKNRSEGHIPRIAFMSGSADPFECVLYKMGLDANGTGEFSYPADGSGNPMPQRIHWYNSNQSAGKNLSATAGGPGVSIADLIDSPTRLAWYDAVILSCEGNQYARSTAEYQNIVDYATAGGRVFGTHYSYVWPRFASTTSKWPATVNSWSANQGHGDPVTLFVDRSFAKGDTFAKWLNYVNASPILGQIDINEPRKDYDYVNASNAQRWLRGNEYNNFQASGGTSCASNLDCTSGSTCGGGYCQDGSVCGDSATCGNRVKMCTSASDCLGGSETCRSFTNSVCAYPSATAVVTPTNTGINCAADSDCGDTALACSGASGTSYCTDGLGCITSGDCNSIGTEMCASSTDCASSHGTCRTGDKVCTLPVYTKTGTTPPANIGSTCAIDTDCADAGLVCAAVTITGFCADGSSCSTNTDCSSPLGEACATNADCTGASVGITCSNHTVCAATSSTGTNPSANKCKSGNCADGVGCSGSSTTGCANSHTLACNGPGDCTQSGFSCTTATAGNVKGMCGPLNTCKGVSTVKICQQKTCTSDGQCATNEWCNSGKCVQQTASSFAVAKCTSNKCPDGTACSMDADCQNRTKTCSLDGDCPVSGMRCITVTSVTKASGGSWAGDCRYRYAGTSTYATGVCDSMTCKQKSCAADADCGTGRKCSGGLCATPVSQVGVCLSGKCPDGTACTSDTQCGSRTTVCTTDADCTTAGAAAGAKCVPSNTSIQGFNKFCAYNTGSGYTYGVCDGSICSSTGCTTDANCGSGQACLAGQCRANLTYEPLMTFNVPVGAAAASQCGRVVYSDFHVSASALSGASGGFPGTCLAGELSPQEKALEYMVFDLTSCLSPDYIPSGGTSNPYTVPMAVTRDYAANCPLGTTAVWHFFDWATHTPGDSQIQFWAQTGPTAASLLPASPGVLLATVSGATVPPWSGVDVASKFAAASPVVTNGAVLRVTFALFPTSDGKQSPTVDSWRQAYDCVNVE
jgi:hypothetical protein